MRSRYETIQNTHLRMFVSANVDTHVLRGSAYIGLVTTRPPMLQSRYLSEGKCTREDIRKKRERGRVCVCIRSVSFSLFFFFSCASFGQDRKGKNIKKEKKRLEYFYFIFFFFPCFVSSFFFFQSEVSVQLFWHRRVYSWYHF